MWPLALLCLALGVAGSQSVFKQACLFEPGHTYIYDYVTQIVNGIPVTAKQFSIFKLKAQVIITAKPNHEIHLQFRNVGFWTLNGNPGMRYDATNELVDDAYLMRVTGPEAGQLEKDLKHPFVMFTPHTESIEIKVDKMDPYWSVNIKRGLTSLLTMQDVGDMVINEGKMVNEITPLGLCNTTYWLTDSYSMEPPSDHWFRMTKVRDVTACLRMPKWHKSILNGYVCKDCKGDKKDVATPSFHVRYTLKRQSGDLLDLTNAVGEGKVVITPYSNQFPGALVSINQTLTIYSKKPTQSDVHPVENPVWRKIFLFYPELVTDPINFVPEDEFKMLDERLLELAAQNTINIHTEEGLMRGRTFIDLLRTYDYDSLNRLAEKYMAQESRNETMADMLLNYMVIAGTWNTSKIVLDKCNTYYPAKCQVLIAMLGLTVHPRDDLANYLMQVSIPKATKTMKKIQMLVLATLAGKMKAKKPIFEWELRMEMSFLVKKLHDTPSRAVRQILQKMIDETQEKLNHYLQDNTYENIIEFIKNGFHITKTDKFRALGNAAYGPMNPFRSDFGTPMCDDVLRVQEILMLHKYAKEKPMQVMDMLMPIAKNTSDVSLVRSAAYWIIFMTSPNHTMMEFIATSMKKELNPHVAAFVTNFMHVTANSSCPCEQSMKKNASAILHLLPQMKPSLELSFFRRWQTFHEYLKMGGSINFQTISTNDSSIPDAASMVINGHALGFEGNLFEIAYTARHFQRFLDNLFGPKGDITLRRSVFDLFARSSRSASNPVQEIMDALRIGVRRQPKPDMVMVVKMFDNVMNVFHLSDFLQKYIENGVMPDIFNVKKWREGISLDKVLNYGLGDIKKVVPMEAGFPVEVRLTAHVSINVTGKIDFTVYPISDEMRTKAPQMYKAHLKMHPKGLVGMYGSVKADLGPFNLGSSSRMQIKVQAPIALGLEANLTKDKIFYAFVKPPLNMNGVPIVQWESTPSTFISILPTKVIPPPSSVKQNMQLASEIVDILDVELSDRSTMTQTNRYFGTNALGLSMKMSGQFAHRTHPMAPPFPFSGKNSMAIFTRTGTDLPEAYSMTMKCMAQPAMPYYSPSSKPSSECDSLLSFSTGCLMSDNDMDDIDIDPTPQPAPTFPDFVDLHQYPSISMEQVRQKLQRKTGKPLPYTGYKWAAIFVFNASGPSTPRGWQMELYWRQFNVSTSQNIQAHFYRTPIPNYDSNKYEATLATEVKYPIWKLEPEKLLDPVYQRQQMLQLQQKFKTTPHGALVGALNNSLYGMAAKTQHAPKMEPEYILDNVVADFLQISSDPEVMKLRVILQQLMPIYEQSLSLYDKSFDLSKMVKHERLILSLVNRSMAIQEHLENLITPCMNNPRNQKMKTVLQYITLRRMETVFTLQRMVEKTLLFPTREFELVPKMHHLYRVTLNFIASILTCMDSTKPESLSIDRNDTDMVGSDMEQNNTAENQQDDMWTKTNDNAICPFVKKQLKVLKELMKEITANVTMDTTKMLILVKSMDNQALHFLNVWQHTETDKMESFLIGAQITIQQLQMLKMYKWSMTFLKPFEQVKIIPFLELRLQQQTGISATITAICYTQYLDSKILPPILSPEEITLLKQHQYLREKIHASQFFRIVYLISDIKNATTSIQMMENLYQEIKAVVLSMKETSWILQQEIHALLSPDVQDPKIALVYKIVKGLIKQKENGNFLRHLRTSFPEQDRKQLYEDIEKLLWMVDIMRGNLSLVFDKFLKHIPEKKEIKQDPMMRMSITFNTEIKLNQQEPIMIKMEARKTLEQCMWEYQQLDPILRSPDFCKHAKWTMGSHGNLSIWDSIIVQQINAYNHIHTLVTSPPITMPKYMKKMLVRTKNYIKYNYYNYSKYEEPKRVLPSQVKIDSVLQLDVHRNTFDLYIDTHNDSSKFYDVPTDSNNAFYVAFMNTNSLRWHLYKKFSGNHLPAKCSMANASISTFDQVVYQVPYDHSQRMVVAMDCSYIMSFAVIARVHNATIGTKTIEIYTASPRLKIVIHPDLTVYVNNEQAHIVPSIKPYIVNTTVYYHHSIIALKLLQYRGMIVAELPLIGLNLVFDGNMLTLRGSAMMREKMCGMCSNFDGCKSYEWEGPQWQHFDSAMDLLQAYTVPSAVPHYASSSLAANQGGDESSKNITTTTTTTHRPQEGDMDSVSMATCFPRPRNVIFQPVLRPSVICFSKVGVPECPPPHCQLTSKGPKVKVPFTCMKKSQQTETWEEMLKSGTVDIIEELKNMKTSRMRRVSTAVECQPNY